MGRSYAGVLGMLACGISLARGLAAGASVESTIPLACGSLFGFAALGWIAGQFAQRFTDESVRARFQAARDTLEPDEKVTTTMAT